MKKIIVMFFSILLLMGCVASTKFTKGGKKIRVIDQITADSCKHIGSIHSFKAVIEGGISAAHIDIRNKASDIGADSVVLLSQYVDPGRYAHGEIFAEAYNCSTNLQVKKYI